MAQYKTLGGYGHFAREDIYARETSNKSRVERKRNTSRYEKELCGRMQAVCLYRLQIYIEVKK
jgi:hypothetical protein